MIKNIKVKASKMDLIYKYSEGCEKFFSYLIENNIVQVDLDVLNILLQNNLRVFSTNNENMVLRGFDLQLF